MPNQEARPGRIRKEATVPQSVTYYSSLDDLKQQDDIYRSLLDLYVGAFTPVFLEEVWTPERVDQLLTRELSREDTTNTIALLQEGKEALGFYCGVSGDTSKMIPFCVETYLADELPPNVIDDISNDCLDRINKNCGSPEKIHILLELLVKDPLSLISGRFVRSVFSDLVNTGPEIGFGLTSTQSNLYGITTGRGIEVIFALLEKEAVNKPGDNRVFVGGPMNSLLGRRLQK